MGKSESGPDMRDCSVFASELQNLEGISITILLELDGSSAASHWLGHVLALRKNPAMIWDGGAAAVAFRWPNQESQTFEGALFRALTQIDDLLTDAAPVKRK